MLVAIEGMDGVGKTSVVNKVSSDMGIIKVEKPGQQIFNLSSNEERDLIYKLYNYESNDLTAWYYFMCYMTVKKQYEKEDIAITDRSFLSTYYYDFKEQNSTLFDSFIKTGGAPDMSIILYASPTCRLDRIRKRNSNDNDLQRQKVLIDGYNRYIEGAEKYKIPYMIINTEIFNLDETSEICKTIISNLKDKNLGRIEFLQGLFSVQNLSLSSEEIRKRLEALNDPINQKKLTMF